MNVNRKRVEVAPGIWSWVTVVRTDKTEWCGLFRDRRLEERGIVVDSGGLLIDQVATAKLLGGPAGRLPEEFIDEYLRDGTAEKSVRDGTVIIPNPDHWGWQYGCIHVDRGRVITLPGDHLLPRHNSTLCYSVEYGWGGGDTILPPPVSGWQEDFEFTATLLVMEGVIVPLEELLGQPRLRADACNLFVFSGDKEVPGEFFRLIRSLLPTQPAQLLDLLQGNPVVIRRDYALQPADFGRLQTIVFEYGLKHLRLERSGATFQLSIIDRLPRTRMPLTGVGLDRDYQFMAVAIDGGQPESAGATIEELTQVMLDEGAMIASLGGGGGDTYVGQIQDGVLHNINVPSDVDPSTGQPGARGRSPNALVIVPA